MVRGRSSENFNKQTSYSPHIHFNSEPPVGVIAFGCHVAGKSSARGRAGFFDQLHEAKVADLSVEHIVKQNTMRREILMSQWGFASEEMLYHRKLATISSLAVTTSMVSW